MKHRISVCDQKNCGVSLSCLFHFSQENRYQGCELVRACRQGEELEENGKRENPA